MNKTVSIIVAAVAMLAAGALCMFKVITLEQLNAVWVVMGPIILAAIGLQQHETAAEIKDVKARMIQAPKA